MARLVFSTRKHLFWGLCVWAMVSVLTPHARAEAPYLEKHDLFRAGDAGYVLYHIPGVTVTSAGTVLVWAEARKSRSDWSAIDILLRRSTDDGKSFDAPQLMPQVAGIQARKPPALKRKNQADSDVTYNNPVFIADRDGGLTYLFCVDYARCFVSRSGDGRYR